MSSYKLLSYFSYKTYKKRWIDNEDQTNIQVSQLVKEYNQQINQARDESIMCVSFKSQCVGASTRISSVSLVLFVLSNVFCVLPLHWGFHYDDQSCFVSGDSSTVLLRSRQARHLQAGSAVVLKLPQRVRKESQAGRRDGKRLRLQSDHREIS